jgi:hypothetical protein
MLCGVEGQMDTKRHTSCTFENFERSMFYSLVQFYFRIKQARRLQKDGLELVILFLVVEVLVSKHPFLGWNVETSSLRIGHPFLFASLSDSLCSFKCMCWIVASSSPFCLHLLLLLVFLLDCPPTFENLRWIVEGLPLDLHLLFFLSFWTCALK